MRSETLFPENTHTQNKPHQTHKHTLGPNTTLGPARIKKLTQILKNILCVPTNPNENVFNSDTNCVFHSFLMLYCFQMQQQQQHHFEENFEDLTLGEETGMDLQEEIPLVWWSVIMFWNFEWRPIAPLQTNARTLVCTIFE